VRIQDVLPANRESLIVEVLHQFESEIESGALILLDETRFRVRIRFLTPRLLTNQRF
jgi:predicted nuclease of predicted toxin-antitoxin system